MELNKETYPFDNIIHCQNMIKRMYSAATGCFTKNRRLNF